MAKKTNTTPAPKPTTKKPAPKTATAQKPTTKKPAAKKRATKKATDWVALLISGADGVKKWNRVTSAERKAAKLARADLSGADLRGANFHAVDADGVLLGGAQLAKAKLNAGSFHKAAFQNADLTDADLRFIEAAGANFSGANLSRADLRDGGLLNAVFAGANLTGANLTKAYALGTDFQTAVLTDVVWDGTAFDADTKWPVGFNVPGELKWVGRTTDPRLGGKGKKAAATDINGLMTRLHATIDEGRMKRTLDMLKKGKNQIFSVVEPATVRGIVRSQKEEDLVYSCVLTDDGTYSCATPDMVPCRGLSNEPCKHLLVLLIGLTRAGEFDPATADKWVVAAKKKNPRWNKTVQNHLADSFLKYKGAQAGTIDWRPTETIPEDYYAM